MSVDPATPVVGEQVVFDASETTYGGDEELAYFWTDPDHDYFFNEGPTHQRRFADPGNHVLEVWISSIENRTTYNSDNIGYGPDMTSSRYPTARETITIPVRELDDEGIDVSSTAVNIQLKTDRQAVQIGSAASLTFSATNLVGNDDLGVQLIVEVPSGLIVNETSYQQGGGQFTSLYEVAEGETVSDRIQLEATEPGPYSISASAVYYFDEDDRQRAESSDIQLRFFE